MRSRNSHVGLLGELNVDKSLTGAHHVLVLDAHDTTSPGSAELLVVVEGSVEGLAHSLKILEVFLVDIGEGDAGSGLLVDELANVGLSADEAEGDSLLSAESGEEDDHLDGVDVVGDDDKLGLVLLNEGGHMVETELEVDGLVTLGGGTGSLGVESLALLRSGLGAVFGEEFKELAAYVNYLISTPGKRACPTPNKRRSLTENCKYLLWFLSTVWVNWLMVGGTFSLTIRILFCLWIRMYLGHLTKRVRSFLGWMSPPILKLRALFLKRELLPAEAPAEAAPTTTFFPLTAFFTYYETTACQY